MHPQNEVTNSRFGLYVILTDPVTGYAECALAAVRAGIRFIQLRMKDVSVSEYIKTAKLIKTLTQNSHSLLIVNDCLEAAIAADADGLHLGQHDMPLSDARKAWHVQGKIFGLSTHNEQQAALAAALMPDYIGVGPVFATPTKVIPDPVLGVENMGRIIRSTTIPAVAIGGINRDNLQAVLANGAVNFASVRPVTQSQTPYEAIMDLQEMARRTW